MTVYYVFLAVAVTVVVAIVVSAGQDKKAQPSIAGGYDLQGPNACIGSPPAPATGKPLPRTAPPQAQACGPSFDVKQSGQFVNLTNTQGTLGGKLRLKENRAPTARARSPATSTCVNGRKPELRRHRDARATRARSRARSAAQPVAADLKRDPPDPGAPEAARPGSIAGLYKLSPRSTCFGGKIELDGQRRRRTRSTRRGNELGTLAYNEEKGAVTGDVECTRGGDARAEGARPSTATSTTCSCSRSTRRAADRPTSADGKPSPCYDPSGLRPSGEKFTATKQRESFGHLVAASSSPRRW